MAQRLLNLVDMVACCRPRACMGHCGPTQVRLWIRAVCCPLAKMNKCVFIAVDKVACCCLPSPGQHCSVFLDPSGHGGMLPTRNDHLAHRILNVKCAVVISMHHVYESGERFDLVTRHVCVFATCSDLTRHQYACLQASLFLS